VTGINGQSLQWREYLVPVLSDEVVRYLYANSGFKNGEQITACVTDIGSGPRKPTLCDIRDLDLQGGTDFFLKVPKLPRLGQ
jgi:hypothetical protein